METLFLVLTLATFCEIGIELAKPIFDPVMNRLKKWVKAPYIYLSALIGLALGFAFNVNFLVAIGVDMPNEFANILSITISGLALGRGTNFVHDILNRIGGRNQNQKREWWDNVNQ